MKPVKKIGFVLCFCLTAVMLWDFNSKDNPFTGQEQRRFEAWLHDWEQRQHSQSESGARSPRIRIHWRRSDGKDLHWVVSNKKSEDRNAKEDMERIFGFIQASKFFKIAKLNTAIDDKAGIFLSLHSPKVHFSGFLSARKLSKNIPLQNMLQLLKLKWVSVPKEHFAKAEHDSF